MTFGHASSSLAIFYPRQRGGRAHGKSCDRMARGPAFIAMTRVSPRWLCWFPVLFSLSGCGDNSTGGPAKQADDDATGTMSTDDGATTTSTSTTGTAAGTMAGSTAAGATETSSSGSGGSTASSSNTSTTTRTTGAFGANDTTASSSSSSTSDSSSSNGAGGSGTDTTDTSTTGSDSSTCTPWPAAKGNQSVTATIPVSGTFDGEFQRFSGAGALGTGSQDEDQPPLFELAEGATLKNVIVGSPAADGIHCTGACTLENVWWEDVGEDAATFLSPSGSSQSTVRCGGARNADDKIFQHNGAGTLTIRDFEADTFGKLYRSCGNCSQQHERHVILDSIVARSGSTLVGLNTNYGDTATFSNITVYGNITICQRYTGNNTGAEPVSTGSGPDGQYCLYSNADVDMR